MKRLVLPIVIAALAVTAFLFRDRWLPQPPGQLTYLGYVEGETVLIGAPQAGRMVAVDARKGNTVAAGERLFALDPAVLEAERVKGEAAMATAEAAYRNLLTGKREPELAVIRAGIEQAQVSLDLALKERERAAMLATTGTAAQARLDAALAQVAGYEAKIRELKASEAVAALPAREEDIAAARSRVDEARATVEVTRRKLAELAPAAPKPASVEDVFFAPGEWVAAGQPVVSLLSEENITLRFFVPEAALAAARPGVSVTFTCDGCGGARQAMILRVAATPEFTPPVIYSEGARAKLVFLAEARPQSVDGALRPGLPIEVEPLP